ncbi:MAG: hypothetical protein QOC56_189 [Alphaproteobacteria bacterium]|nr:hypothetical protein [Alphaproteobacteria bacterium]
MSKTTLRPLQLTATLIVLGLYAAPAQAVNVRSFVSSNGNDGTPNACTRAQPCRTFAYALSQTITGGEINVLDPGGYGAVTINKSISIVNDGVGSAGVLVGGGATGITISAPATDVVNLRGLIIEGTNLGSVGIQFNTGKSLVIENCVIRGLQSNGISFQPNASSNLAISNTLIADNGANGVVIAPSGTGVVNAAISRVGVYNNGGHGITVNGTGQASGQLNAVVAESVSAGNTSAGLAVFSQGGSVAAKLMVARSESAQNGPLSAGSGLLANGAGAALRVGQSAVTGNGNGWQALNTGTVSSYADNYIDGNLANELAPPAVSKK